MDLVAIEEIRQLKYRYLRSLDLKLWDEFEDTFAPDATANYGAHLSFGSRAEVVAFMREMLGPAIITVHHCHHPEIQVDGDEATGVWHLDDTVIITEHRMVLHDRDHSTGEVQ